MTCENCGEEFDPIRTRWLCPHCGRKHHCCEVMAAFVGEDTWVWRCRE